MRALRVYLDTSVIGGCYDDEFSDSSTKLIEAVCRGAVRALLSDTLVAEIAGAPRQARETLRRLINSGGERLSLTPECEELRNGYLLARVVSRKYADDAMHVAHATLAHAVVIASWNFKHLLKPMRIRGFNGVNTARGYGSVLIMTPTDIVKGMEA